MAFLNYVRGPGPEHKVCLHGQLSATELMSILASLCGNLLWLRGCWGFQGRI
jgi:hypothetical protein